MAKRTDVTDDVKIIASGMGKTPTRDEYHNHPDSKFSKHEIGKHFSDWPAVLHACGLKPPARIDVTSEPGYQVAKLKQEIKDLNKLVSRLEQESLGTRRIRELIGAPDWSSLGEESGWMRAKRSYSAFTGTPTLFLSDVHYDEVVRPEQVNGANSYNHEIANRRIKNVFGKALDLSTKFLHKPKFDGFICAFGGDNLSGNIHEELKETNDQRILKSLLDLTDLYAEGLGTLADEFGKVFCPCVVGNHGRMDRKPRYKFRVQDNFEWLIYQWLARYFKNDSRISFYIPEAPDALWEVQGHKYLMCHGDEFKGGTGISGLFPPLMIGRARKLAKQTALQSPFDHMLVGHWHTYVHTDQLIINNCVKGYDEYANGNGFPFSKASQAFWIDNDVLHGAYRMPILCD